MRSLIGQVGFDKGVLTVSASVSSPTMAHERSGRICSPATIPEVQHEIAHEFDITMLHIYCRSEPPDVLCNVILEDDGAHGGLAGAGPAHQQDFALFVALAALRGAHDGRNSPAEREIASVVSRGRKTVWLSIGEVDGGCDGQPTTDWEVMAWQRHSFLHDLLSAYVLVGLVKHCDFHRFCSMHFDSASRYLDMLPNL